MKKITCILCVLLTAFSFCGCVFEKDCLNKEEIFSLVETNEEQIRECIAFGDFTPVLEMSSFISIAPAEKYVDFACGGKGLSVSGKEYGFYYSSEDVPLPCHSYDGWLELEQDGEGWSCSGFYTERICQNFYFYEAWF